MRAFLRKRGWRVPWLGPFFQVPEARRELFPGGPTAVLYIAWDEDDDTVSPAGLAFESAAGTQMLASELPRALAQRDRPRRARRRHRRTPLTGTGRHIPRPGTIAAIVPVSVPTEQPRTKARQGQALGDCPLDSPTVA